MKTKLIRLVLSHLTDFLWSRPKNRVTHRQHSMPVESFQHYLASIIAQFCFLFKGSFLSSQRRPLCLSSHLLLMELYVARLSSMPRPLVFLISITAYYASLLPCWVCLDAQYEFCQNTGSTCGNATLLYPFGVGERGCSLPGFQIDCVEDVSPIIAIHDKNYIILTINYDSRNFIIFKDDDCGNN